MHKARFYTLVASCPDQVGIISRVTAFIAEHRGWLLESSFHADDIDQRYFMRIEVRADSLAFGVDEFRLHFASLATELKMHWRIADSAEKKRVVVMVSQQEHCLYDLLARWQSNELNSDIVAVISNHHNFQGVVEWHGIPFHHVPVMAADKQTAFDAIGKIVDAANADTIVLARYMQILPAEFCARYPGRVINIHHSFLPSFVGAKPYHQAYTRGVKLIGATCHYVTEALDEGPIIEQDVIRIDHSDAVEDIVRYGKDIEKTVLARGLRYHLEDRVLLHGNKTVVFR
ncbi:MAG: formyltetrahydrofolate deformylase [Rhodocyclaceae bacterium]|nr:formyltetrahydrofolate deformylase [Rhodocyclaceae bacterium]MBK9623985.1 formyltetrahydrofolate deformylase [Rhodocyclaceae bacterium]MBL0076249.1 formyltetrahydrofolate deformylase [Rhodocyclaceae bacterium]MBP6109016.1 formyltetrahydrofolate deformylase [Rhodocyclaceae bacterium]MBP6279006.1 formyltetrahydrofolate deformylase [Rhodocyclaceae bacterium]